MSLLDLTKKVQLVLDKKGIIKAVAEVKLGLDISGSMSELYSNGTVQKTTDRISAVAVKFDDNETLDAWTFSSGSEEITPIVPSMFGNYVDEYILENPHVRKWGGTNYGPVIKDMMEHYGQQEIEVEVDVEVEDVEEVGFFKGLFGAKPTVTKRMETHTITKTIPAEKDIPAYCIIITDGENGDKETTKRLLQSAVNEKIFFMFVGIGNEKFTFLKSIKDMSNVDFIEVHDLNKISDEDLYDQLISDKFANWLKN